MRALFFHRLLLFDEYCTCTGCDVHDIAQEAHFLFYCHSMLWHKRTSQKIPHIPRAHVIEFGICSLGFFFIALLFGITSCEKFSAVNTTIATQTQPLRIVHRFEIRNALENDTSDTGLHHIHIQAKMHVNVCVLRRQCRLPT